MRSRKVSCYNRELFMVNLTVAVSIALITAFRKTCDVHIPKTSPLVHHDMNTELFAVNK